MVGKIATPGWMYNFSYERVFVNMSFGASTSLSAASVVLLDNIIRICAKKTTSVCVVVAAVSSRFPGFETFNGRVRVLC